MSNEIKKNLIDLIIAVLLLVFLIIYFINVCKLIDKRNKQSDYIQNLEEKLNIYERSYEESCLEDSIRQVE